jgi:hypothetical protein
MTRRVLTLAAVTIAATLAFAGSLPARDKGVDVIRRDADRRVDVLVGGRPFTSYVWPGTLKKPALYPIRTAKGTPVTRGFPLDPRPRERVDHPHQVGLWFNYGNVNGIDFWNNSEAVAADRQGGMGSIVHRTVTQVKNGAERGELHTQADWVMPDGTIVLKQATAYVFQGAPDSRTIDLAVTLTAQDRPVSFADNKEGLLGLRVTRALEEPTDKPEVFTDGDGRPSSVPALENTGVNGEYLTSEGVKGPAVWGTRGRWCRLAGRVGDELVSIGIFDHPSNVGFPTYWHARGYGLFAANPLGQKDLSGGREALNFSLAARQATTFRYRIAITSGAPTAADVEAAWKAWSTGS